MKKTILLFGLISGLIVSTFMATSMAIMASGPNGCEPGVGSMIVGYASMLAAFSFVFVGIRQYRDKQNGGTITFGKGLWIGLAISFIASTLYVITWAVEFHLFLPGFMDQYAEMQVKELQQSGVSGAAYDSALNEIESMADAYKHNGLVFALYTYMEIFPVGILVSLIAALVLKRKTKKAIQ